MFLAERFQQFYAEVIRLKARVKEGSWVFPIVTTAGTTIDPLASDSPNAVWRQLLNVLERQSLDAGREGGELAVEIYRRAQYAMASLADEIFLNLQWSGRETWRDHLLETKLFGTHNAGEELFARIDQLLRDRDAVYAELARIYLTVLALGFQGKFRGQPDADQIIEGYRRRLFRLLFNRDPQTPRGAEHLTPQAYGFTMDEARRTQLPYLRPWLWAMAIVVLLWLGVSQVIWRSAVSTLEPLVDEIIAGGATSGARQRGPS